MTVAHRRPLPTSIDDIDREWMTQALRGRSPGVRVDSVEITEVINGTCTKVRLHVKASGIDMPERLILKGGFEGHSREMGFMHRLEVRGYLDVLKPLQLPSPELFFAEYDEERQQGILIMEDLAARDVRFCHPLRPQSFGDVRDRLEVLAAFHAKSWNDPRLGTQSPWRWMDDVLEDTCRYAARYLKPDEWARFIALPRAAAVSVEFHDADWMADALARLARLSATLPHCALHGDTHLGNLYVDTDGTPGFFDCVPGHGPAMAEISYHMVCALDQSDRARWEGDLIRHYLDQLTRHGIEAPGFEEAMRQYALFMARTYFIFLTNEAVFQKESINTAYTARIGAAMVDHDTLVKLKTIA